MIVAPVILSACRYASLPAREFVEIFDPSAHRQFLSRVPRQPGRAGRVGLVAPLTLEDESAILAELAADLDAHPAMLDALTRQPESEPFGDDPERPPF